MRSFWIVIVFGLLLPLSVEGQPKRYLAKILIQVDHIVDPGTWQKLTEADRAKLRQAGLQILESDRVLRSPPAPLAGYWVQVGTYRYPINRDGLVFVEQPVSSVHAVKVFAQLIDSHPFLVVPSLTFVPEGQNPAPALLKIQQKLSHNMN